MQNKPNFKDAQMNVSNIITMNYQIFIPLAGQKNKPNSNPNKPNLRRARMNISSIITKDYRKKDDFAVRKNKPNSKPISKGTIPNFPQFWKVFVMTFVNIGYLFYCIAESFSITFFPCSFLKSANLSRRLLSTNAKMLDSFRGFKLL